MTNGDDFVNPDCLPVERLSLPVKSDGVVRMIKALDPHWVEKTDWRLYWRMPSGERPVTGALDAWTINTKEMLDEFKFLLSLRHHRFWSHMIHAPRCMDAVVSFLQEAEPPYLRSQPAPVYRELRARVASVLCRLVTERESQSEWMSREYLGKVIYDKYLLSIPTLWDACLLYGIDNPQPISRFMKTVFALEPRFTADLETAIAFVQEVFKYTICQVNNKFDSSFEPPNLPETFKGFGEIRRPSDKTDSPPDGMTLAVLNDLVLHLVDSVLTIRVFTEVYPPALEVLKKRGFILSVVQLYENAIPVMYEKLDSLGTIDQQAEILERLDILRSELIDVVREQLAAEMDAMFCEEDNKQKRVADYLAAMMDVLSEKTFVRDYGAAYPVHDDLEMLRQAYPDMDSVKIDFILQAIYSNMDDPASPKPEPAPSTSHTHEQTSEQTNTETDIPSGLKEDALISEVKDILPHLGEGFILKCLQHYGFNSERVINSILEGNLDPSLQSLDQSMPIIPPDPLDEKFLQTGIDRLNVFDGDEFDIMSRDDVDVSRIHVGKRRERFRDLGQMLDDKTAVKQRMDIYSKYNLVTEEENMYSDEYDDTYDSQGPADPLERRSVRPRVLQQLEPREEASSSSEEEESEQTAAAGARKPLDFCVNPELLRERREANRRAAQRTRAPPPKSADVVGRARGQGQEKEVLVNRERKNQHKSARANHNRRQGASWKRSQGLLPS